MGWPAASSLASGGPAVGDPAAVRPVEAGEAGPQPDPGLLGDQHQLGDPAQRRRPGAGERGRPGAGALVAGHGEAGDQPAAGQRPRQPDRDAGAGGDGPHQLLGRLHHGLQRVDRPVGVALPGAGPQPGRVQVGAAAGAARTHPHEDDGAALGRPVVKGRGSSAGDRWRAPAGDQRCGARRDRRWRRGRA